MKNLTMFLSLAMLAGIPLRAFDGGKGGWKLDADGKIEMKDGDPVWIDDTGNEGVVQRSTISRLNAESRDYRVRAEAAETKLSAFKDIDPVKAKEAFDKLSKVDQKRLIDAGEVDRVKDEIKGQYEGQLAEEKKANADLQSKLDGLVLETAFNGSKFISDNLAVPTSMARAEFQKNFKVEDGKIVPYDGNGNRLLSKTKFGEVADFDEALSVLVDNYPHKDAILRANPNSGSGNNGGGGNRGGGAVMKRADFERLTPADQSAAAAKMGAGELKVVD